MKSMVEIFVLDYPLSHGGGTMYAMNGVSKTVYSE